uniref:Uncharacterized protein n=1 Tax=viral metagenome TaxID=1070528 RepID=A0A6M3JQG9_9ZZZZ
MKQLQLVVEIKEEVYDYTREEYSNLLMQARKVNPRINQLLIDTEKKLAYCYSNTNTNINNLIA